MSSYAERMRRHPGKRDRIGTRGKRNGPVRTAAQAQRRARAVPAGFKSSRIERAHVG